MADLKKEYTSNVIERVVLGAWAVALTVPAIVAFFAHGDNTLDEWLAKISFGLVLAGFVIFLITPAENALKKSLGFIGFGAALVSLMLAFENLTMAFTQLLGVIFNFYSLLQQAQPDSPILVMSSLAVEMALTALAGFIGYFVLYRFFILNEKIAIGLSLLGYSFLRDQLTTFCIAFILAAGANLFVKELAQVTADESIKEARKRGKLNLVFSLAGISVVLIGLFFSQVTAWATGFLVIFSSHPFTTLSIIVQGFLVGGWFAIKSK